MQTKHKETEDRLSHGQCMFSPGPDRHLCDRSLPEQVTANDLLGKQQEERMEIISPFIFFP